MVMVGGSVDLACSPLSLWHKTRMKCAATESEWKTFIAALEDGFDRFKGINKRAAWVWRMWNVIKFLAKEIAKMVSSAFPHQLSIFLGSRFDGNFSSAFPRWIFRVKRESFPLARLLWMEFKWNHSQLDLIKFKFKGLQVPVYSVYYVTLQKGKKEMLKLSSRKHFLTKFRLVALNSKEKKFLFMKRADLTLADAILLLLI